MQLIKNIVNECFFITTFFAAIVLYMFQLDAVAEIMIILTIAVVLVQSSYKERTDRELYQYIIIVGIPTIIMFLVYYRYSRIRVLFTCLILAFSLFLAWFRNKKAIRSISLKKVIMENGCFTILLICFVIISVMNLGRIPVYDSGCYYSWGGIYYLADFVDYSIKRLMLAGHLSIGYSFFALAGELLLPHRLVGVQLVNVFLAVISFCGIYHVLHKIALTKSRAWIVMPLIMFNPMTLGMIWETNIDNPGIYILLLMIYAFLDDLFPLFYMLSFLFVFTKEPNVVYYFFFLIGAFFYEMQCQREGIVKVFLLKWKKYTVSCIPMLAWLLCYLSPSFGLKDSFANVGGDSIQTISFNANYIKIRTAQFFIENFQWAIVVVLLVVLFAIIKMHKTIDPWIWLIISVMFSLVLFNLAYVNYTHTRYISIWYAVCPLLVSALVLVLDRKWGYILSLVLSVLVCAQTFYTVDPVSCLVFQKFETGTDSKMFSTGSVFSNTTTSDINDSVIYNMEYYRFFEQIEEILDHYSYDEKTVVYYSDMSHGPDSYGATNGFFYFDTKKKKIMTYCTENSVPLVWGESVETMEGYNKVIVIKPFLFEEDEELMLCLADYREVQKDVFDDFIHIDAVLYE